MIVFDSPKVILQLRKKSKSLIFQILTWSDVYGLYMYALETCVCSRDMCLLLRHYICCLDMGYALWRCLLVGEEYMVSSCWRRIYEYGRCVLVGKEYMNMEDVLLVLFLFFVFVFHFLFVYSQLFCERANNFECTNIFSINFAEKTTFS